MAIVFQEQKRTFNWVRLLFFVFVVLFIAGAAYFLFFAPTPRLDVVLPAPLERASQISSLEFVDPSAVLNSRSFRRLQNYIGPPGVGSLGKPNPFAKL